MKGLSFTPSHPFTFNAEKALEVALYIANRADVADIIHICKVLYFADRFHLEEYGRFICGDHYVAMSNGPVPSGTYDIIKSARSSSSAVPFVLDGFWVNPLRDANLEALSESDREALDQAIRDYGSLPVRSLIDVSHDEAWRAADENSMMPVESIAATLRDSDALIEHLVNRD